MASTATNKQPLLVDHVLHYLIDTNNTVVATQDVSGTNSAAVVVDSTTADGAIIEAIYTISRGTTAHTCNLYIPKGYALWVALQNVSSAAVSDGPIFGVQGGWF